MNYNLTNSLLKLISSGYKLEFSLEIVKHFIWIRRWNTHLYYLFRPNYNDFIRLIKQSTTLARFRNFAASFRQQDRFCVRERKDLQDSKFTIFEVRQKINDKLVAKIIINSVYYERFHAILIINSSNIQVVTIKSIFKILPWDHEVWITNVGKIDYSAAKLLENMLREYEPASSKFTSK